MNRWIIVPVAGGLFKTNMLISSGNWPGLQGPHEVHLCQGHREGQRALAAGHGLHLFLEVQVVLEALVDQEAPCGNIVVYIFFFRSLFIKIYPTNYLKKEKLPWWCHCQGLRIQTREHQVRTKRQNQSKHIQSVWSPSWYCRSLGKAGKNKQTNNNHTHTHRGQNADKMTSSCDTHRHTAWSRGSRWPGDARRAW